jgi:hypothetical protein
MTMAGNTAFAHGLGAAMALALSGFLVGCTADTSEAGLVGGGGPTGTSTAGSTTAPLLADVDTNATLVTTPGSGIGVYVEYVSGGHWKVSWTCDTSITNLTCNFIVDATVTTGAITNESAEGFGSTDTLTQTSSTQIEAVSATTLGVNTMFFDTTPGTTIQVSVRLDAPVSFFFVQDGKVNGGYTGALTNPLLLQPTTP